MPHGQESSPSARRESFQAKVQGIVQLFILVASILHSRRALSTLPLLDGACFTFPPVILCRAGASYMALVYSSFSSSSSNQLMRHQETRRRKKPMKTLPHQVAMIPTTHRMTPLLQTPGPFYHSFLTPRSTTMFATAKTVSPRKSSINTSKGELPSMAASLVAQVLITPPLQYTPPRVADLCDIAPI